MSIGKNIAIDEVFGAAFGRGFNVLNVGGWIKEKFLERRGEGGAKRGVDGYIFVCCIECFGVLRRRFGMKF